MSNYLKRFEAMFKELESYSFIEPLEFLPQPPVTTKDINAIESKLGAELDPIIRSFYKESNGLKLHWRIKRDLGAEQAKEIRKKSSDYKVKIAEYIGDPFALINIIPIQESVLTHDWIELKKNIEQKKLKYHGKSNDIDQIKNQLKPFDLLNTEYCMTFLFPTGTGKPQVLLLSDGYAEWDNSKRTDFETYMEMLLATRGIVEARIKIFEKERGDLDQLLTGNNKFWQENYTPKLFKK